MNWEFNHELKEETFKNHENITLKFLLFKEEEIKSEEINFETIREVYFKINK